MTRKIIINYKLKMTSKTNYIIHGTTITNLHRILQDGYIASQPSNTTLLQLENHPYQIFTQLIFADITNEERQQPFWFQCAILLDKQILKDLPFYATQIGGFHQKFSNGMASNNLLACGDGNLTRIPNLTKLRNHINAYKLESNISQSFTHSHELMFGQDIPLAKYCKGIAIYRDNKELKNIRLLCNKIGLPLIILKKKKGINQLLEQLT